ncbi:hypothetical protein Rt10032_c24g6684 [Rhodotorula toruloides]|uniref:F-box domain-containing protein n=1 Tax=Rhodotorula toruloides TaxID=5286 RepID=A0A511KQL8_RHOTO|nr:hypothetical protein Rt10032_c24g6684 [Rhodotorula toruloides]
MPLNLPIELVRHILVALGPFSLNADDRQDVTQKTLCRCCLASRALKEIAQPLLYKAVLLRKQASVYKFASAVKAGPELPQLVQTYKMPSYEMWIDQRTYDAVRNVVTSLVELRRLWMSGAHSANGYPSTCSADFAMLPNLESLTMTAVRLSCSPPEPFHNLVQLAFMDNYISEQDMKAILRPDITPSLRAVHLDTLYNPDANFNETYLPIFPSSSLTRLDMLQLSPNSNLPRLPYLFKPDFELNDLAVQFYTTGNLPLLDPSALQHILLLWSSTVPYRPNIKPYRAITDLLRGLQADEEAISQHLRSISLPLPLLLVSGKVDEVEGEEWATGDAVKDAAQAEEEPSDKRPDLAQVPIVGSDEGDEAWGDHDEDEDEEDKADYSDSGEETEEKVRYIVNPDEREKSLRPQRSYDRSTYRPSPRTRRRVRQILDFAAAHKIDVVWHDWNPRESDSMVSKDFWRYAREKKAGTWRG